MAKCTLRPEFLGISGRIGNMVFQTRGDKVFAHAYRKPVRTTPVTPAELQRRQRFALIQQEVSRRIRNGDRRLRKLIWAEAAQQYDAAHPRPDVHLTFT